MTDASFYAGLSDIELQKDHNVTVNIRTIFSSQGAIIHLIEESGLTFAPGLANMIQSQNPPSV